MRKEITWSIAGAATIFYLCMPASGIARTCQTDSCAGIVRIPSTEYGAIVNKIRSPVNTCVGTFGLSVCCDNVPPVLREMRSLDGRYRFSIVGYKTYFRSDRADIWFIYPTRKTYVDSKGGNDQRCHRYYCNPDTEVELSPGVICSKYAIYYALDTNEDGDPDVFILDLRMDGPNGNEIPTTDPEIEGFIFHRNEDQ
ncbi:MAG: hypothetical protein JW765_03395 [Deltaproteobacteria bacterium]|nr:hypothetical protein [Candidatus Zymogenaceae bacterium]